MTDDQQDHKAWLDLLSSRDRDYYDRRFGHWWKLGFDRQLCGLKAREEVIARIARRKENG